MFDLSKLPFTVCLSVGTLCHAIMHLPISILPRQEGPHARATVRLEQVELVHIRAGKVLALHVVLVRIIEFKHAPIVVLKILSKVDRI